MPHTLIVNQRHTDTINCTTLYYLTNTHSQPQTQPTASSLFHIHDTCIHTQLTVQQYAIYQDTDTTKCTTFFLFIKHTYTTNCTTLYHQSNIYKTTARHSTIHHTHKYTHVTNCTPFNNLSYKNSAHTINYSLHHMIPYIKHSHRHNQLQHTIPSIKHMYTNQLHHTLPSIKHTHNKLQGTQHPSYIPTN